MSSKTAIPDLTGYIAIVTGGNSGIGYETTRQLAIHHARVYIASRSQNRVEEAITKMKKSSPGLTLDVHFLELDLQSLEKTRVAAAEFLKRETKLDILINNAGIMGSIYALTKDGHETQWQTLVLGPHAFFTALVPALSTSKKARIVNVSSDSAFAWSPSKGIDYKDPNLPKEVGTLGPWKRYGQAKLGQVIQAKTINDKYHSEGITAYSLHPGIINTNLQAASPGFLGGTIRFMVRHVGAGTFSIEDGARTTLYCATNVEAAENAGGYFQPFGKHSSRADKWLNEAECKKLWDLCEKQTR